MSTVISFDAAGKGINMSGTTTGGGFLFNDSSISTTFLDALDDDTLIFSVYGAGLVRYMLISGVVNTETGDAELTELIYGDADFNPLFAWLDMNLYVNLYDDFSRGISYTILNTADFIYGNIYSDFIKAGAGNDAVYGYDGADTLYGEAGNDTLDGGAGADTLIGGAGDDIYYVDNVGDVVTESSANNTLSQELFSMGNNNDVIVASVSYTLSDKTTGIEDLMAAGDFTTGADTDIAINLTGNKLAQALIGNDAINVLNGMAGDDILVGFGGADTLNGGDGNDGLLGGAGDDSMSGGKGNDIFVFNFAAQSGTNLIGETSDAVYVTGGSDTADGGEGNDILFMQGSLDNYSISRIGLTQYRITTNVGNAVSSDEQITFQNIERLKFGSILDDIGSSSGFVDLSSINIASGFKDIIRGTSGNDTLDGGAGADTLIGGAGDDIYYVDNVGDVVTESSANNTLSQELFSMGNNNDVIVASVSYTLSDKTTGIEDLMAAGDFTTGADTDIAINLTGNKLAQALIGNDAINVLNGMAGDDILVGFGGADTLNGGDGNDGLLGGAGDDSMSGGKGNDIFVFNFAAQSGTNLIGETSDAVYVTGGSDTADGGEGNDILFMQGSLDNYSISRIGLTQYRITTNVGNAVSSDEQITFQNIERLKFGSILDDIGSSSGFVDLSSINIASGFKDIIRGTSGNDTLDGGAGADTLIGGAGDDIYYVDNVGDVVTESSANNTLSQELFSMGNNNDVIVASVSYTLSDKTTGIEDLMAAGDFTTGADTDIAINLTGNKLAQALIGNDAINVLNGMAGDDILVGFGGADTLNGGDGNDGLLGGAGDDSMSGGKGNDIFVFNFAAQSGTNLIGETSDAVYVTGGSDTADGGEGNDILFMQGSLDNYSISRIGLTQYRITTNVGNAVSSDEQITFQNIERLKFGSILDDIGSSSGFVDLSSINIASGFKDIIRGTSGNDTLDGGAGADTLIGGAGDDIYVVDNIGDKTTEVAAQGTDTVRSSITWTALAANVENLTLTGTGAINGTGNTLNNIITGNSGNNILNGGAGNDTIDGGDGADTINGGDGNDTLSANAGGGAINGGVGNDTLYGGTGTDTLDGGAGNDILYNGGSGDTLIGGAGNDIYYVDSGPTTLRESANGGIDTIITSISFDLQWLTNHENLTLTGSSSLFGAGNSLANAIIGNDGDNTINGSLGNDTLTGGLGNDIFVFNTAPNRTSNVDRITDFSLTDDTIQLENAVFTGLGSGTGTLDSSLFRSGAGFTAAGDSSDRIIYNTTSGALFYDADGTGGTAAVQIALIGNQANLTVADLVVI